MDQKIVVAIVGSATVLIALVIVLNSGAGPLQSINFSPTGFKAEFATIPTRQFGTLNVSLPTAQALSLLPSKSTDENNYNIMDNTYTSQTYHFKISAPTGWNMMSVTKEQLLESMKMSLPSVNLDMIASIHPTVAIANSVYNANINILVSDIDPSTDITQYVNTGIHQLQSLGWTVSDTNINSNQKVAYYSLVNKSSGVQQIQEIIFANERAYAITITTIASLPQQGTNDIYTILQSFTFI